jgi:hypothetical protein
MADKFDKFTERARRVLTLAQEEAQRFNHNYIGTEHFLLGLVREGDGVAARVLNNLGVELADVRAKVEFIIGRGEALRMGEIGLTPRAKKVVEYAVDEARRLNHHYIGTEHLLLGLLREGSGIASGVLESLGVSLERVRAEVLQVLGQPGGVHSPVDIGPGRPVGRARDPRFAAPLGELVRVIPVAQRLEQDDTAITCIALELYSNGFIVTFRHQQKGSLPSPVPAFAVTGEDDRGGHYVSIPYSGSGGGAPGRHEWRFAHRFAHALDAATRTLSLTLVAQRPGGMESERHSLPWRFMITLPSADAGGGQA